MLITSNKGKFEEYKGIFTRNRLKLELMYLSYPEEQLDTLEEVAERSSYYLRGMIKDDFIIDDSGLFIESLQGFPGVYSSYVNKTIGNQGILKIMETKKNRNAVFKTCIAYYDKNLHLFTGEVPGRIISEMKGENGFGFDPIFVPEEASKTYAQMATHEKNSLSHRSKAAALLVEFLEKKNK